MEVKEYISREAAESALKQPVTMSMCLTLEECKQKNAQRQIDLFVIRGLPAADVRPVVLCKDCSSADYSGMGNGTVWRNELEHAMQEDDFCSRGEKREES